MTQKGSFTSRNICFSYGSWFAFLLDYLCASISMQYYKWAKFKGLDLLVHICRGGGKRPLRESGGPIWYWQNIFGKLSSVYLCSRECQIITHCSKRRAFVKCWVLQACEFSIYNVIYDVNKRFIEQCRQLHWLIEHCEITMNWSEW